MSTIVKPGGRVPGGKPVLPPVPPVSVAPPSLPVITKFTVPPVPFPALPFGPLSLLPEEDEPHAVSAFATSNVRVKVSAVRPESGRALDATESTVMDRS